MYLAQVVIRALNDGIEGRRIDLQPCFRLVRHICRNDMDKHENLLWKRCSSLRHVSARPRSICELCGWEDYDGRRKYIRTYVLMYIPAAGWQSDQSNMRAVTSSFAPARWFSFTFCFFFLKNLSTIFLNWQTIATHRLVVGNADDGHLGFLDQPVYKAVNVYNHTKNIISSHCFMHAMCAW